MSHRKLFLIAVALIALPVAADSGRVTTVLVPSQVIGTGGTDGSSGIHLAATDFDPTAEACLLFDLSPIPKEATIQEIRLRLVAKTRVRQQSVDVLEAQPSATCRRAGGDKAALGGWDGDPDEGSVFEATLESGAVVAGATLRLFLSSSIRSTNWTYFGPGAATEPSDKPRLIVTYTLPEELEPAVSKRPILAVEKRKFPPPGRSFNTLLSGPLRYKDSVVTIAKPTSAETGLYSFSTTGDFRWDKPWSTSTEGVAGTYSAIHGDYLYNFGTRSVSISNLADQGAHVQSVPYSGLRQDDSASGNLILLAPPTIAAGGNIYFVGQPSDSGVYLYGLSPYSANEGASLQPILRVPIPSVGLPEVSGLAVSPPGPDFRVYAVLKNSARLLDRDAATGDCKGGGTSQAGTCRDIDLAGSGLELGDALGEFRGPLLMAGDKEDFVVVAGTRGLVVLSGGRERLRWPEDKATSGNVEEIAVALGPNLAESFVIALANNRLHRLAFDGTERNCESYEFDLGETSNLVVDGAGRAYFWSKGTFYGYDNDEWCSALFATKVDLTGPPNLVLGPDATLVLTDRPTASQPPTPQSDVQVLLPSGCVSGWRYEDQGDGTVLDCNTDLLWLKSAGCIEDFPWSYAKAEVAKLESGKCGLADGSRAGFWRLPTVQELCSSWKGEALSPCPAEARLTSLVDSTVVKVQDPGEMVPRGTEKVTDARGSGAWSSGNPFYMVSGFLPQWSSTEVDHDNEWGVQDRAWSASLATGNIETRSKGVIAKAWPVREKQPKAAIKKLEGRVERVGGAVKLYLSWDTALAKHAEISGYNSTLGPSEQKHVIAPSANEPLQSYYTLTAVATYQDVQNSKRSLRVNWGTDSVVGRVGFEPSGLAISADGKRLYVVTAEGGGEVSVLNAETLETIDSVRVGSTSTRKSRSVVGGVAVSDGRLFVVFLDSRVSSLVARETLWVFDAETLVPLKGSPVKTGRGSTSVAVSASNRVFVANLNDDSVTVLDARTLQHVPGSPVPVGRYPSSLALSPDGNRVYVANQADATVSVLDSRSLQPVSGSPIELGSTTPMAIAASSTRLFIASARGNGTLSVVDTATLKPVAGSPVDRFGAARLSPSLDGETVFVTTPLRVFVYDSRSLQLVSESGIRIGDGGFAIVTSPDGTRVYVANRWDNTISVLSPKGLSLVP